MQILLSKPHINCLLFDLNILYVSVDELPTKKLLIKMSIVKSFSISHHEIHVNII
jgi:hypothetical protein